MTGTAASVRTAMARDLPQSAEPDDSPKGDPWNAFGYVVTDVWESQQALDRFLQTLGPMMEQAGSQFDRQEVQILEVHNLITGS